jgi:small subunit ribosomal protein S4
VSIPSYLVRPGDVIELREKSKKVVRILESLEGVARRGVPQWLELDKDQMKGSVKGLPNREEITIPIQEKLIVELFSK